MRSNCMYRYVEGGGNLLDAHVGVYEIVLAEVDGEEIDPLQGGLLA